MTRVVWTNIEKLALKECMVDICCVTPMMGNKDLLQHAQAEVLPYERRQKITDQKVFTHKAMINEARASAEKRRSKVLKPVEPPKVEPPPPIEPVAATIGDLFEQLLEAVVDRVMAKIEARRPAEVKFPDTVSEVAAARYEELFGGPIEQLNKLTIRPKPKQPTVLVVGLNGCQMETIRNYKPGIDFTFATAEQALSLRTMVKDHTILMTKFINHSVQGKYRKHPNLHYCNGGVSDLKHLLHIVFHKETI